MTNWPLYAGRRRLWDCEGEMLTWNDDPIVKPNSASKLLAPPSRFSERKNRRKVGVKVSLGDKSISNSTLECVRIIFYCNALELLAVGKFFRYKCAL